MSSAGKNQASSGSNGKWCLKIKGIFYAENHNAGFENTGFL